MADENEPKGAGQKRNIILTYEELSGIHVRLAEISGKLDQVPTLVDENAKLELRVRALELQQAAASTRRGTWENAWVLLNTVILTIIAILTYLNH